MNTLFGFMLLAIFPVLASAESTTFSCDNDDSSVIFVIERLRSTGSTDTAVEAEASATLLAVKMPNYRAGTRLSLTGKRLPSAKGPYYELSAHNINLFLSAPASKSYDELALGRSKAIEMICQK